MHTVSRFPIFSLFPRMDHQTCRMWRPPHSKTCDCTVTLHVHERSQTSSLLSGNKSLSVQVTGVLSILCLMRRNHWRMHDFPFALFCQLKMKPF